MLTKDDNTKKRDRIGLGLELQNERLQVIDNMRTNDARIVERSGLDPTDPVQQRGTGLKTIKFFRKLQKIVPSSYMRNHPGFEHKAIFGIGLGEVAVDIVVGEFPWMPEWSVLEKKMEEFPTISPNRIRTKGGHLVEHFSPEIPPMQLRHSSFEEIQRGWRTILLRYIMSNITTVAAVEEVFGRPNRASWAVLLKLQNPESRDLVF